MQWSKTAKKLYYFNRKTGQSTFDQAEASDAWNPFEYYRSWCLFACERGAF